MKLPLFHGNGKQYLEQHWFVCESIWLVKHIVDEYVKITLLKFTIRDYALVWYIKFKSIAPTGVGEHWLRYCCTHNNSPFNFTILWEDYKGPYQNFWILHLCRVFDYLHMTNCSYLLLLVIEDLKLYYLFSKLWIWWLVIDLVYPLWFHKLFGGWMLLLDSFLWYVHDLSLLSLYLSFRSPPIGLWLLTLLTLPMTLSP